MAKAILKKIGLYILLLSAPLTSALAQEITAINFDGTLIGKVIPDGTVINFDNEVIGNINVDSFVVNEEGALIGGVVPQGVVIGNDNRLLGKVNNDGSVRLATGQIVGKVLPNGLVINDANDVLGAVLYPGLIYNDAGVTVGRLAGDGSYVNLAGQNIGFVSALGYAYRRSGDSFVLDGRLIPSKMVISLQGVFLGSVAPGGKVADFDGNTIGQVHADGYVYDQAAKIIGMTVTSGYAFDLSGQYLGLITYNGEVVNGKEVVGRLFGDGSIVDAQNNKIGFSVDIAATASTLDGRYLGRVIPQGQVVFGSEIVGFVGPHQTVLDAQGTVIGEITQAGPVFDYLGNLVGQISRNGQVLAITGTPLGYAKGRTAHDNIGRVLGAGFEKALIFDANNHNLGLSGINSAYEVNGRSYKISPFGYVYTPEGALQGHTVPLSALYKEDGAPYASINADGALQGIAPEKEVKLTQFGLVTNPQNDLEASSIAASFAVNMQGESLGTLRQDNTIMDSSRKVVAKILPQGDVVASSSNKTADLLPVIGAAEKTGVIVGINGGVIGHADISGLARDFSKNIIGRVLPDGMVADSKQTVIGFLAGTEGVVNDECGFIGVVGQRGDVRNTRDVVLGRYLANRQVVSETGNIIGHGVTAGAVYDYQGKPMGLVNTLGGVINYAGENVGCVSWNGRVYSADNKLLGKRAQSFPVMNFNNRVVGRSLSNGQVANLQNRISGFIQPDGTYVSENEIEGLSFEYKFAFSMENKFMGRVNTAAEVISDEGDVLGKVNYDGMVVADGRPVGYALYDLYIYDENGHAIGYLNGNGKVISFSGSVIGSADRGFLVNSRYDLIGRGRRDYFVRDNNYQVIGELRLDGNVVNQAGEVIGTVTGSGEVRNADSDILARARPLQYYNVKRPQDGQPADWAGTQGPAVGALTMPTEFDEKKYGLKAIGIALTPDGNYLGDILENNSVVDKNGNVIGNLNEGLILDNNGNLIGIEDNRNPSGQEMFVPAGTFGDGGAYGLGNTPTNLGPGGGFGPGERYDPVRSAALAAAQAQRRGEITVGQLSTNVDRKSFDGRQSYWDNAPRRLSSWRVDMSEMILADKPIPAVLARTIMSTNGADDVPVTAIVERNVYAEEGRNIVIPAGSRIMGTSSGGSTGGNSGGAVRVNITWNRLIRPDGSAFEFSAAKTGDAQGRGGALAYLDEQLLKRYTLPIMTSLMTDGLAYIMATGDNGTSNGESSLESSRQQAANDARQHFLQNMDTIFQQILQDKTNIQAVTYVPAGTRLIIYPREDLWIRTMERTQEEMQDKALSGKGPLIDGTEGNRTPSADKNSSSGSGSVVYLDEDVDAKPTSGGLIDETPKKKTRQAPNVPAVTVSGATPPPPSSSATSGLPASTNATRNDDSTAQLF